MKAERRGMKHGRSRRAARVYRRAACMFLILMTAAFLTCFCHIGNIRSMAQSSVNGHPATRYYTCIQLEPGDTLWSLAERYRDGSDMTAREYVNELRRINNIAGTKVHAGHMLTVCYYR